MQLLSNTFSSLGYWIVSDREYYSNIKGRHSYINLRTSSTSKPRAIKEFVQVIGAMDPETVFTHFDELESGGYIVYDVSTAKRKIDTIPSMLPQVRNRINNRFKEMKIDGSIPSIINYLEDERKINTVGLNYPTILVNLKDKFKLIPAQASRYVSSILFGAIAGLADLAEDDIKRSLEKRFYGRANIIEQNQFLISYVSNLIKKEHSSPLKIKPSNIQHRELMVGNGNDVVAMGKIIGGLRYQSYYPITPAADESFFIESYQNLKIDGNDSGGIIVLQTEDEIAAIASAIGASLTGTRSATATSGPGFSLMVEGLGWAGINEVPVVITYYQRSGPSTGQATRGSQADLLSTLFASHGEFAKIVIASGDHEEAFNDAIEAFNLAEKYQVPTIHLLDKFLANSMTTMPLPNLEKVKIERGEIIEQPKKDYKRFDLTKLISPRAPLGSDAIIGHSGSEHDEHGRTTEDPFNRIKMYEKRIKKLEIADSEIPMEHRALYYGSEKADFLLVGWGYTKNVALEALENLEKEGYSGAYLHIRMFSPFPSKYVKSILEKFSRERTISIEHNFLAQASMVVRMFTSINIGRSVVKYTGRPMYLRETVEAIKQILDKGVRRVVLSRGS